MGAMAPPPHWIPEDDLLLKNAVEAGASLESLAKGAVQFSRRFTIQELQGRWFSLLYDPVVSEEASDAMIEVERSAILNQPRLNKLESVKEITCSSAKRKGDSIRRCYYAMRKRICNEPFDMMGINLLSGPDNSNFGDGNEFSSADCGIGDPISNDLVIQGPEFDIRHRPLSEFGPHAAESTGSGLPAPCFNAAQNRVQDFHLHGKDVSNNLSYPYEENISLTRDHHEVPGFGQSKELPLCNLFEVEGLETEGNACSEFRGPAFRSFGCSSPLLQMPIWSTGPEISASGPVQIGEKDKQRGDAFIIPQAGEANETEGSGYGGACSNSNLKTSLSCGSMTDIPHSTEDYFAELSNTLFNFTNDDELLFMDTDGRDTIDKSYYDGLSSLLLDSPNQSELPNVDQGEGASDGHFVGTSGSAHPGGSDNKGLNLCYRQKVPDAQVASSASTVKGFGPEYRNGVICCTLNTEDLEIPSNDDVFLPFRFPSPTNSSGAHWRSHDPSYLVSSAVKDFSSTRKANIVKTTQKDPCLPYRMMGSSQPSDVGLKYPIGDHAVRFELPKSNIQHVVRSARNSECPNHISAANACANNFITGVVKGGAMEMERGKDLDYKSGGPSLDTHDHGLEILQSLQKNASGSRNGRDAKAEYQDNASANVELSCEKTIVPKPIDKFPLSDQEELLSENDFDVPYFSDVEAMILDMDLSPDEFDIYTNPEVQRYQHEETKRTILRLEQAANACTQRAIAAEGAFAILYGRWSKHFIKKPEVILGRATDDAKVDIDLGREKNGGKISRRQAIMKMDIYGIFHLKNLGRHSISVNGKGVAPGQNLSLTSGCLIQVRGLAFVFETNNKRIKQYVDSIKEGSLLLDHKPSNRS